MKMLPFIPKEHQDLPDNYSMTIYYVNGKKDNFEMAQHRLEEKTGLLEFATKDDLWNWIPLSSIQRVEFDKNFSKIVAIRSEMAMKQKEIKNG